MLDLFAYVNKSLEFYKVSQEKNKQLFYKYAKKLVKLSPK